MGTLGVRLIEKDPERYGGRDPDDLERLVSQRLTDPATRPDALRELRRVFPATAELDDDTVASKALERISAPRAASAAPAAEKPLFKPLTFGGAASKEAADIQRALSGKAGAQAYKGITKNVALRMSTPVESEAARSIGEAATRSTITPAEYEQPRVRVGTWEDFQREMQKNPSLKPVEVSGQESWVSRTVGPMFPRVQLQDESGRAVMQMKPGASYPAVEVKGHPSLLAMTTLTGETDPIEQAMVSAASRIYDPGRKEGERWGNVLTTPPAGRGLPEYGAKAMQAAAEADPTAGMERTQAMMLGVPQEGVVSGLARGVNWLGAKASMAPDALAYAAKKAAEFLTEKPATRSGRGAPTPAAATETSRALGMWAEQNADELAMAQQALENEMRAARPDIAGAGENIGYAARMFNPISASGALAAGAVRAVPAAREAFKRGAQAVEKRRPTATEWIRGMGASETPSTMLISGQEAESTMRGGIAAARAEGELLERKTQQDIKEALSKATGVTDPAELERLDRMALENWATPEQRLAAVQQEPRLAAVYETLQPLHERTYRAAYPEGQYDPFKIQYGQDISKRAKFFESRTKQAAAEDQRVAALEQQLDVGSKLDPASLQGVPGFNQQLMQRATVDPVYAAEEARLLNEVQFYQGLQNTMQRGNPARSTVNQQLADASRQLAELQQRGPQYSVVPRRGRALQEMSARATELNLRPKVKNEIDNITATGGIARTFRRVREGQGLRQESLMRRTLVDDLPVYKESKPKSFTDIGSYAIQHNINTDIRGPGLVDWKREEIGKEMVDSTWQDVLRENDDVLLKVIPDENYFSELRKIVDYGSRAGGQHRIIHYIPQSIAPKNVPDIVDRRVAQALEEAANPSAAMRVAREAADAMESILATAQINKALTLGRPGFSARNRTNEIMRMLVHDPATLTDRTVLSLSEEVSHAPIGAGRGRVVTELPNNPITKRPYTTGELHELALSQTGMGQGITQEGAGLGQELPQGFWGTTRPGAAFNRLVEAGMSPGVKFNEAVDEAMKQALMPGLAPEYKLEDGFRLRTFINELKNGVRPAVAGNTSRNLLIDFGDKNALQTLGKTVFPFIKYQSSAVPLVMELVARNPQRYARTYQIAQALERDDAERHGGTGINVKYKSLSDVISGAPMLTGSDKAARVYRPETVGAEVAGAIEGWGKVLSGEESPVSMAGPAPASVQEYLTGVNPARGRNVYQLPPDVFQQLEEEQRYAGALGKIAPRASMAMLLAEKQARERAGGYPVEYLGQNPRLATTYQVMEGLPLVSRPLTSEPWQLALRTFMGGSNPASRSQEATEQMLQRAVMSWLTGMRSSTVDYAQEYARQQGKSKQLAKPVIETMKRQYRKGRIGTQTEEQP